MKKSISYIVLSMLTIGGASAAPLTPDQALKRVENDINAPAATRALNNPVLKKTFKTISGTPALYVFDNSKSNTGFMVLSADDALVPVLGYSTSGSFDAKNLAPALEYWLEEYQRQIEYAADNGVALTVATRSPQLPAEWEEIQPLVKTIWNQSAPFNDNCPEIVSNGVKYETYTGCVATAMAQVMNYFKYPEVGQGSITYKSVTANKTLSIDFADTPFDWDNMLDSYNGSYTEEQAEAVATLMQAAGYSVQMDYTTYASGAVAGYIPGALINYFKYDNGTYYLARNMTTYTQLATLLYNNLKNVGPVIYNGESPYSGGHSFICDGYRDGYFHFNWGWGGASDGYFLLDALDPSAIGIGGAGGGFNYRQDLILNIQPAKEGTQPYQDKIVLRGSVEGYVEGNYMGIRIYGNEYPGFSYYGIESMTFNVGCIIEQVSNPKNKVAYVCANNDAYNNSVLMPLDPGYIVYINNTDGRPYPIFALGRIALADNVTYKVTLAYQKAYTDEWIPVEGGIGSVNYFYVTKKNGKYNFENEEEMQLTCTDLTLESELYDGNAARFAINLTNEYDTELSRSATLLLLDKNYEVAYMGSSFALTLAPGETYVNNDWLSSLTKQTSGSLAKATNFYLALYDLDTDEIYYISDEMYTMQPYPGFPEYTWSIEINNGTYNRTTGVWYVDDATNIQTTTTLNVISGVFSIPMTLVILTEQGNSVNTYYELPLQLLGTRERAVIPYTATFPDAIVNQVYKIGVSFDRQNITAADFQTLFKKIAVRSNSAITSSGVEEIGIASEEISFFHNRGAKELYVCGGENGIANIEAYYLNGQKAALSVAPSVDMNVVDLSSLGKGIVVVTAVDNGGNRRTVKITL